MPNRSDISTSPVVGQHRLHLGRKSGAELDEAMAIAHKFAKLAHRDESTILRFRWYVPRRLVLDFFKTERYVLARDEEGTWGDDL